MVEDIPAPVVFLTNRAAVARNWHCSIRGEDKSEVGFYYVYDGVQCSITLDKETDLITRMHFHFFGASRDDGIDDVAKWLCVDRESVVAWFDWEAMRSRIVRFHVGDKISLVGGYRTSSDDKNWVMITDDMFRVLDPETWAENQLLKVEYAEARRELSKFGGAGHGFRSGEAGVMARARVFAAFPRDGSCWIEDLRKLVNYEG